jgi:hypothetical protein
MGQASGQALVRPRVEAQQRFSPWVQAWSTAQVVRKLGAGRAHFVGRCAEPEWLAEFRFRCPKHSQQKVHFEADITCLAASDLLGLRLWPWTSLVGTECQGKVVAFSCLILSQVGFILSELC